MLQVRALAVVCLVALILLAQNVFAEGAPQRELPPSGKLNAAQALSLLKGPEKIDCAVIDVRTPAEYEEGHIPGAVLLPIEEMPGRLSDIPDDKPVILVCRTGIRAGDVWNMLRKARPDQVAWYIRAKPKYMANGEWTIVD